MKKKILLLIIIVLVIMLFIIGIIYNSIKNLKEDNVTYISEGGSEVKQEQINNNINLEIVGLNEELRNKIPNQEEFLNKIKEYMYTNGLINIKKLEIITFFEENSKNQIHIKFLLNDQENIRLITSINLEDNTYNFVTY